MPKSNAGISVNPGPTVRPPRGFSAGGDLVGTVTSQTVVGLQGFRVSQNPPGFNQVLKYTGAEWAPQFESSGGATEDIGAIHPASFKRMVGGLVLPNIPGAGAVAPGSILVASSQSNVRGSALAGGFNTGEGGIWALSDGVAYHIGHPSDNIVGAIPLFDDDSTAVSSGPEPMAYGAGKIWALTVVEGFPFPTRGALTRIDPDIGVTDYGQNKAGQGVITGRLSVETSFPGFDNQSYVFYDTVNGNAVVYCPNAFLDKPGGVFYAVDPVSLAVTPYTLANSDTWPGWTQVVNYVAVKFADDGLLYAIANVVISSHTERFLIKIDPVTKTILDVIGYGLVVFTPHLEFSNLLTGKFYFASDVGVFYRASISPFQDDGFALDTAPAFAAAYGSYSQLWSTQTGGAYDQTIAVFVGNTGTGDTLLVDVNTFDMTLAGTTLTVGADTGTTNGAPTITRIQYVPYPESGWWLFDSNNAKIYRYFGFGAASPYGRFPFGGTAQWELITPGSGPLTFDTVGDARNIRATWDDFSPVDTSKTGILNISVAGGEPNGAKADYATIIGGHDHSVYGVGGTNIGGINNENHGDAGICLAGNGNVIQVGGERSVVGGSLSNVSGANSVAIGRQASTSGAAAAAFGGNNFSGSNAASDNSFVHGAGGISFWHSEYIHSACVESDGTTWWFGRFLMRGHSTSGSTTTLMSPGGEELTAIGNKRSTYIFTVNIMATRIFGDATPGFASWIRTVTAHIAEDSATLVIDSTASTLTQLNGQTWSISITAVGLTLHITLTGTAGHTIRVTGWIEYGFCLAFPNS